MKLLFPLHNIVTQNSWLLAEKPKFLLFILSHLPSDHLQRKHAASLSLSDHPASPSLTSRFINSISIRRFHPRTPRLNRCIPIRPSRRRPFSPSSLRRSIIDIGAPGGGRGSWISGCALILGVGCVVGKRKSEGGREGKRGEERKRGKEGKGGEEGDFDG